MNISYSWLKDFVNIDLEPIKLAEILTDLGLEIGGIEERESVKGGLKGLIIGEVKTCEKHPNADKLSVTTVDVGGERLLDIVCGAPNVAAGQKVVVATVGTVLYDGDNEFKIKKSKIRGSVSEGMICAEDEIGVGTSHDGIIELPQNTKIGINAAEYYNIENDTVFEVDLTPNRVDGASHYGCVRDLAAYFKSRGEDFKLNIPSVDDFKVDNNDLEITVDIAKAEACKRYSGVSITGIEIKESPEWLQNRLKAIGLNPINNIVDITNYVLHETGQPLHAFDADKITSKKVVVNTVAEKTKFKTLDDEERELSANDLMICNDNEPMCIAGVFGGADSGVSDTTKNIFLESAYFDSVFVRKTAKRHGLNTDSSFRFERGTDPNYTIYPLKRAALLIKELAGGKISSDIVDIYPNKIEDFDVTVSFKNITRLIGEEIPKEQVVKILESLEIKIVEQTDEELKLKIPTYRVDVTREADVIEEILRVYGYNNVKIAEKVNSTLSYVQKPDKEKIQNLISDMLSSNGFSEMMANSLTKADYYQNKESYKEDDTVKILNPLSQDLNAMRQTLLFGSLEAVIYNSNRKNSDIKLFEFGNTYKLKTAEGNNPIDKFYEEKHLSLVLSGYHDDEHWKSDKNEADFFHLKAYVELVLMRLGFDIDKIKSTFLSNDIFVEGLLKSYFNTDLVQLGMIDPKLLKQFDINFNVFYADFNWDNIIEAVKKLKFEFTTLSKHPEVRRDLSLLLDEKVTFAELKQAALKADKKLMKRVDLFDFYKGDKIEQGKKSYALSFILQDADKTLTDKQIDKIMNKIQYIYEKQFGAVLR